MASIEQVKLRFRDISQIGLRTRDRKEGIVLSPHNQHLRLLVPKEFMPAVVECEVRLVVVKQVKLDGVIAGPIKEELIHGVRVRIDSRNILRSVRVLENGGFFLEQVSHRPLCLWIAIHPERLHWIEGRPDTLDIGVPVLHDNPFDCVRVPGGNAIAHWRAVVLHVDAELLQAEDTEEQFLDRGGKVVEGVIELAYIRRIAVAETNVIRAIT